MGTGIKEFIASIWQIVNGKENDPIVIGLIIGLFSVIIANFSLYLSFRARLKDKDLHIKDLVNERNKLQDYFFKHMNLERKTTKKGKQ